MDMPDPDTSRAVLIGVSHFHDLPDLPAIRNNLGGLAQCFRDPSLWGLPAAHCIVVPDPESTVALLDPVHDAAAEAEDTLLLYYAGHGKVHDRGGLLLTTAGYRDGRAHTAVHYDQVREKLMESRAARKVVILDCCFSGQAIGVMSDPSDVVNRARVEGTCLLTATPATREALSPPGESYTAFTGALLRLLTDGIPDGSPLLRLNVIFRALRDTMERNALPEPQMRIDNTAADLPLVRNRRQSRLSTPIPEVRAELLRRYQRGDIISNGRYPVVIAADTTTGRTVVMKQVPFRGERTLRTVTEFDHPGIVRVLDTVEGWPRYVVMEHIEGWTLSALLRLHGRMWDYCRAVNIVARVCDALDYGHRRGVVHGVVDSSNVMLTGDGEVKVLNFGLAVAGANTADIRSDVYDAGWLLFELLTGDRVVLGGPVSTLIGARFPIALCRAVHKAVRTNPAKRYQSAAAMRDALLRFLEKQEGAIH
jgi:Caspase domain/Protein kinase domain